MWQVSEARYGCFQLARPWSAFCLKDNEAPMKINGATNEVHRQPMKSNQWWPVKINEDQWRPTKTNE